MKLAELEAKAKALAGTQHWRGLDPETVLKVCATLAKAREALEWYAWGHTGPDGEHQRHTYRALCDRCQDTGQRARQTLKEIDE